MPVLSAEEVVGNRQRGGPEKPDHAGSTCHRRNGVLGCQDAAAEPPADLTDRLQLPRFVFIGMRATTVCSVSVACVPALIGVAVNQQNRGLTTVGTASPLACVSLCGV